MRKRLTTSTEYSIANAVADFIACCEGKNLSRETIIFYRHSLAHLTRFFPDGTSLKEVTTAHIRELLVHMGKGNSPATVNHTLAVVKRLFKFHIAEGNLTTNVAESVEKLRTEKHVIQTFSQEQLQAILNTCERDFLGIRDRAALLLLMDTGLRSSELCGIEIEHLHLDTQSIWVMGKGRKARVVPFGESVKKSLLRYLTARKEVNCKSLFVTHYGDRLNKDRLGEMVRRRGRQAGITGVRCSPHTFRHTAAVNFLRSGGDTFSLQRFLGHSSQEMTAHYCESLSAEDVQAKHRLFSPVDNMKLSEVKSRKRLK